MHADRMSRERSVWEKRVMELQEQVGNLLKANAASEVASPRPPSPVEVSAEEDVESLEVMKEELKTANKQLDTLREICEFTGNRSTQTMNALINTRCPSLYTLAQTVQTGTTLYSFVQTGTSLYRQAQPCTALYRQAQPCIALYRQVHPCADRHCLVQLCTDRHSLV